MASTSFRRMLRHTPMRDLVRGRITGRLDIDRLLDEASLSGEAADTVRRVVKHTRLWRLEKVDVANELISHFTDGLEAGTPKEELIKNFGDKRQTAKLIRRAKKRQRPMPWHVFAWARLCLLIFVGVYILAALYLAAGSPSVTTDYLAKLNAKAAKVPEGEAAWPIYREALIAMDYSQHEGRSGFTIKESALQGEEGWEEKLAFIDQHTEQIAMVRKAARMPKLGYRVGFVTELEDEAIFPTHDLSGYEFLGPHPPLIGALLQNLAPLRAIGRLLSADTVLATEDGDAQRAYDNVVAIFGIARHAEEHPLLINGLVMLSIQQLGYLSIQDILTDHPELWSNAQLQDLAHTLGTQDYSPEDWFNGERLWFYDYLQRAYTDDGQGGGHITSHGLDAAQMYDHNGLLNAPPSAARTATIAAGLPIAAALIGPRDEMRQLYDSLMDQTLIELRQPLWQPNDAETVEAKVDRLNTRTRDGIRYSPIMVFFPSVTGVRRSLQAQEGYRDGVLVGIALELYRRAAEDYPQALNDLVPTYLPRVPTDRLTGDPVRYILTETGPVVYSIGVDGDDDGGRPPVERDGDVANDMASPKMFTGELRTETEHDGDWVLWPVPDNQ